MKHAWKVFKYITIFALCIQMIGMLQTFGLYLHHSDTSTYFELKENPVVDVDLKPIIASPVVDVNDTIRVSFDNSNVLSYAVEADGLIAIEVEQGSMEYDLVATEEYGVLDVYATYADDVVVKSSIYTYRTNTKVYVSDVSKDQAWYSWIEELIELGELALNEAQELYYELCAEYVGEFTPTADEIMEEISVSNKTIIQGKLFWQESETEIAPLIKVKVQLIKKTNGLTQIISSQYSAPDGSFRFEIDNSNWANDGEDIFIRWWLEAETFKVTNNWIFDHYCFQSLLKENIPQGSVETLYYLLPCDTSTNHYNATYVHQGMVMSERFAIEMGMRVPDYDNKNQTKLNVAFPSWLVDQTNGYCYSIGKYNIASIGINLKHPLDLYTHEYGHYVQNVMNIYGATLLEVITNWPEHHPFDDQFSNNWKKEFAMEMVWSEAWASAFSTIAEHYYWCKSEPEYTYFGEVNMYESTCIGYDLETPNSGLYDHDGDSSTADKDNRGETQEASVQAFLWDLFDGYSSLETFDEMDWGYNLWWHYTTKSGIYTLEDFTQRMYNDRPDLRDKMGKIMSFYKIAPEIKSVSACNKNTPPTIIIDTNGSQDHPNNRFEILFYDESGNLLVQTSQIEVNNTIRSEYTFSNLSEIWETVLAEIKYSCNKTYKIYVAVAGYRYDDALFVGDSSRRLSGPYISSEMEINLSVEHSFEFVSNDSQTHKLYCINCNEEIGEFDHNLQYSNITSTHHTYGCAECGYSVTSAHDMYTSPSISLTEHGRKCRDCGYVDESTVGTHSYNSFMYVSDTAHRSACDVCGVWKETTSPHTFTILDRFGKMACIGCGYTKYFGSDSGNIILSITKVSANGSYILPDGTIVLAHEDIEAYLNGTLVFYDKGNVPQTH